MSNRRSSLALLAGVVALLIAIQKFRETVAPVIVSVPLLQVHKTPIPIQPASFADSNGIQRRFADSYEKHLLVNVWATWCPPCRREMPALDRLQAKLGASGEPEIVAVSVDRVSFNQLRAFYSVAGISNLAIYRGEENEILQSLGIVGLPTTLLIDHGGREIARLIGPTVWDDSVILEQLSTLVTAPSIARRVGWSHPIQSEPLL